MAKVSRGRIQAGGTGTRTPLGNPIGPCGLERRIWRRARGLVKGQGSPFSPGQIMLSGGGWKSERGFGGEGEPRPGLRLVSQNGRLLEDMRQGRSQN